MDGRDIGSVVFPFAELKVYMTASSAVRANRRMDEYQRLGDTGHSYDEVLTGIERRDHEDMSRAVGPLKQVDDAVVIDTDKMTIQQQIDRVVELIREREAKK